MFLKRVILAATVAVCTVGSAWAQSWTEPARGSQQRKDLMSAVRPIAEWQLGAPVQFVVNELRVSGDIAFAMLQAQRPGGQPIDLEQTPGNARGEMYVEDMDGARFDVLYKKSGNMWVAVTWTLGATEAWWSWKPICDAFGPVIEDYCQYVE
ncbi:hypothetical protein [Shimia sp.]|uniref:hypothetical protein n=1 Tax=Shimia sp. TaxID=1954381 RepID=UPI003105D713